MPLLLDDMTGPDRPVTRRELHEEIQALLQTVATKEDLKAYATKEDLKAYATKEDLKAFATKEDLKAVRDELRVHFDVVAEKFKDDCHILFDGLKATTESLQTRVGTIDTGHGARLLAVETRVTALEARRKRAKNPSKP